jgi:hypothetical protein
MKHPKIIQISNDDYRVYALDENGEVWWHNGGYYSAKNRTTPWQRLHVGDTTKENQIEIRESSTTNWCRDGGI